MLFSFTNSFLITAITNTTSGRQTLIPGEESMQSSHYTQSSLKSLAIIMVYNPQAAPLVHFYSRN